MLLFHAALGAENAVVELETVDPVSGHHLGGTSHVLPSDSTSPGPRQRVPVLTVDQFAIADLSLVQLDVEGYEREVLLGAQRSIRTQRPVVIVEDNDGRCSELLHAWDYTEARRVGLDHVFLPNERAAHLAEVVRLRGRR